uniref:Uncharacterized protein n=1 Tax=Pipistrellus kuhlii TaxID=59472 RepID=A0A7J7SMF4_PIPKU|nr:hypothetical protein mPipKuh1_009801 [Pipistrellus kuhlii]
MSQAGSWALSLLQACLAPGRLWENNQIPRAHTLPPLSHTAHMYTLTHTNPWAPHCLPPHQACPPVYRPQPHSTPTEELSAGAPLIPFRPQAGWRVAAQTRSPRRCRGPLSPAPSLESPPPPHRAPPRLSARGPLHRPHTGGQARPGHGGWDHKGVSTTTGSGSFLPQAASD